jgi:putative SOS response-associated peptidase YedK
MCGRYVSPTMAEMERYWNLSDAVRRNPFHGYEQHFNIAPTVQVPVIFPLEGQLQLALARWGLVPFWWNKEKMPPFTFNARIEEAATKPMWREAVKTSRCLLPAIGWYEWKMARIVDPTTGEVRTGKQPYFLRTPDRRAFAFAGLMAFRSEGTAVLVSAAIVTRAAKGPAADVHTRMPLILPKKAEHAWLDREQTDGAKALEIANEVAVIDVVHHAVSSRVNNSKNLGAELIEPFPNPA